MKLNRKLLAVTLFPALLLGGCGASETNSPGGQTMPEGPAETIALYKASCISCHGTDLKGRMNAQTDIRDIGSRLTPEMIQQQIENGGSLMPGFKHSLSEQEIQALTDWLAGLKG
ncbi:c-type cytochrome [Paenibacillus herberti]|uniref:Cytochrome C551 n=1 Tax=Paenibacillus herberti TaxID=1619309 RepID=A0A229NUQ0_9BACL|nr:cytochrome c [Paenibacillus herberti]OXM13626.1 cytochrome C551 [Paenibacillus herberti]